MAARGLRACPLSAIATTISNNTSRPGDQATPLKEEGMEPLWLRFYDPRTPHTLSYPDTTLDHLLVEAARDFPDRTAITFVLKYVLGDKILIGGRLAYWQLHAQVDRCATALAALGVQKGDRVAIMLPNSLQFVTAFFAALRLGAIVVNVNPTYTAPEIQHQLEDSGAETIVLLNLFLPRLRKVQAELPQLKRVIVTTKTCCHSLPVRWCATPNEKSPTGLR
jgi:long-chain acyl-CoA synthetase